MRSSRSYPPPERLEVVVGDVAGGPLHRVEQAAAGRGQNAVAPERRDPVAGAERVAGAVARQRQVVVVVGGVEVHRLPHRPHARQAAHALRGGPGLPEGGQQEADEQGDDRNHDQQLDERERAAAAGAECGQGQPSGRWAERGSAGDRQAARRAGRETAAPDTGTAHRRRDSGDGRRRPAGEPPQRRRFGGAVGVVAPGREPVEALAQHDQHQPGSGQVERAVEVADGQAEPGSAGPGGVGLGSPSPAGSTSTHSGHSTSPPAFCCAEPSSRADHAPRSCIGITAQNSTPSQAVIASVVKRCSIQEPAGAGAER